MKLLVGDCLEQMKTLSDNSVDAVVTDPPYGLSFMNKKWDYDVPSVDIWREVYRVLKPGGHVLSFGGTRTYHRMVVNIEDAGFEIRDQVQWIYGSGFPKSHNVSKAIAKLNGEELASVGEGRSGASSRAFQSEEKTTAGKYKITKANNKWDGWGSALKPANEPICLARKPLEKGFTLAENVLKYRTGAINVDGCRIKTEEKLNYSKSLVQNVTWAKSGTGEQNPQGRWPANVLFDEDAAEMLDAQSGPIKTKLPFKKVSEHTFGVGDEQVHKGQKFESQKGLGITVPGASRFFYVAKASKKERNAGLEGMSRQFTKTMNGGIGGREHNPDEPTAYNQNFHPTVKPIKLMEYLITLITPPNGTVLDPFMGSGSTGVAARRLGFDFIGCEMSEEYVQIATKRIEFAKGVNDDNL